MKLSKPDSCEKFLALLTAQAIKKNRVENYIEAYRFWRVDNGFLQSTFKNSVWQPSRPLIAEDLSGGSVVAHGPGIYAYKTKDDMQNDSAGCNAVVFGKVALWGSVVVHEKGYRARYAQPMTVGVVPADAAAWMHWYYFPVTEYPGTRFTDEDFAVVKKRYGLPEEKW